MICKRCKGSGCFLCDELGIEGGMINPELKIGCYVQPRGGGEVIGELIEFNANKTGALIHWNDGNDIWKALRNLEVVK